MAAGRRTARFAGTGYFTYAVETSMGEPMDFLPLET